MSQTPSHGRSNTEKLKEDEDYQARLDKKIESIDPVEKKELKAILERLVKSMIDTREGEK